MIGGGLALNDTGFRMVQATCPTSSVGLLVTLFLSPGAEVCSGVTNEKEKGGVYEWPGRVRPEGPRRPELCYELGVQACA